MIPSDLLVSAYASGWFPMAVEPGEIRWYSPDPRGIIPLDSFHVPARLSRVLRSGRFQIEVDRDFDAVIRACAEADRDDEEGGTWIDEEIMESYCALNRAGLAHSVEAWEGGRLAGGLYGVALGGAFFGALVDRLRTRGYHLLDVQWVTPHLQRFGAIEIPRRRYLKMLEEALGVEGEFS
jgi:leucyl/phenylalanyl-tRNA--protein transferase